MALYISSINSGSNGNCYYVGNENEAVLIDAGISCREIEKRMLRNQLDLQKVKAIFISHEHSDHIRGLEVLAKKLAVPVYITNATLNNSGLKYVLANTVHFDNTAPISIGELSILPFVKHHDAADPYSFTIRYKGVCVGVFTDIGVVCQELVKQFKQCHAAFLESNYCPEMLDRSAYPYFLKRRISGGKGHLSNAHALELFLNHRPDFMTHLLLCHLSKNNNDPRLVEEYFKVHAASVHIGVASRDREGEVYFIAQECGSVKVLESVYSQNTQFDMFS